MFPLSSDCFKEISLDAGVPRMVGAVLDYCLRGLVAAGRGMLRLWPPCVALLRAAQGKGGRWSSHLM